ncbi:hypothetical protein TNCV_1505431 [Trichonephila clavipes]|nr:hypothetical protein TNCV_1505431 [Trichonephila clavipes]
MDSWPACHGFDPRPSVQRKQVDDKYVETQTSSHSDHMKSLIYGESPVDSTEDPLIRYLQLLLPREKSLGYLLIRDGYFVKDDKPFLKLAVTTANNY